MLEGALVSFCPFPSWCLICGWNAKSVLKISEWMHGTGTCFNWTHTGKVALEGICLVTEDAENPQWGWSREEDQRWGQREALVGRDWKRSGANQKSKRISVHNHYNVPFTLYGKGFYGRFWIRWISKELGFIFAFYLKKILWAWYPCWRAGKYHKGTWDCRSNVSQHKVSTSMCIIGAQDVLESWSNSLLPSTNFGDTTVAGSETSKNHTRRNPQNLRGKNPQQCIILLSQMKPKSHQTE